MRRRPCAVAVVLVLIAVSGDAGAVNQSAPGQRAPINTSEPSISGDAIVGSSLSANVGSWQGPATAYAYQWSRCRSDGTNCSPLPATAEVYALLAGDLGATLRVTISATNKNGTTVSTSSPSAVVVTPPTTSTTTTTTPPTSSTTTATTPSKATTTSTSTTATSTTTPTTTSTVGTTTSTSTSTTTTTPTTTTSPPSGNTLYAANWESGRLDANWGVQCNNIATTSTIVRGSYTVVSGIADTGIYAARVDLPASTTKTACEFLHSRLVGPGVNDYYTLAFKLPTNWQEPSSVFWGQTLSQFNYEGINSAPLGLAAHADNVTIVVNGGACPASGVPPGCPYYSGNNGDAPRNMPGPLYAVPRGQLALGVWHELVIHVHWALDGTGAVNVWHRLKGGTWMKTVSLSGYPTLQTGTTYNGTVVTAANIASLQDVDKFGSYRGPSSFSDSVWFDSWCRSTTFDAAASCLG